MDSSATLTFDAFKNALKVTNIPGESDVITTLMVVLPMYINIIIVNTEIVWVML